MATLAEKAQSTPSTAKPSGEERLQQLVAWVKAHRRGVSYVAGVVVLAAALVAWNIVATRRSELVAGEELQQARLAFEERNYPLAASEFARIRENYGGTGAAEQATLLLAQTRLLQGQGRQAVDILQGFAGSASAPFRAQAQGLLGAALENVGESAQAAAAFEAAAAAATEFPSMKAQFLSDAGRAWTAAGDTGRAVAAYQQIVRELSETGTVPEATVRLGELTKGAVVLPEPKTQ